MNEGRMNERKGGALPRASKYCDNRLLSQLMRVLYLACFRIRSYALRLTLFFSFVGFKTLIQVFAIDSGVV